VETCGQQRTPYCKSAKDAVCGPQCISVMGVKIKSIDWNFILLAARHSHSSHSVQGDCGKLKLGPETNMGFPWVGSEKFSANPRSRREDRKIVSTVILVRFL